MNPFANYLIEANLGLIFFSAVYFVLLFSKAINLMTSLKYFFIFMFFTIVIKSNAQQNAIAKKNLVTIYGSCADTTIKTARIILPRALPWADIKQPVESDKSQDNTFAFQVDGSKERLMYLQIFNGSWPMFVTPGDSVHFTITHPALRKPHVSFTGKNAAHYNFFPQLDELIPTGQRPLYKGGNLITYKTDVSLFFQKKMNFYTTFLNENVVSERFKLFAKTEIEYEKFYYLYYPVKYKNVKLEEIPSDYFSEVSMLPFTDERLLESNQFKNALGYKYIHCYTNNPWENFDMLSAMIINTFKGKIREYLVSSLIAIYAKNQSQQYSTSLQRLVDKSSSYVSNPDYQQYITSMMQDYLVVNLPFPKPVLTSTYLKSYEGERMSLADLLKKYEGKAIYIDLWANWCGACRLDIAESLEAKSFLKSKDVAYIYISIDKAKDENKWIRASQHDGITQDQYLLEKSLASPFAQLLKINFIPRYVILDANHTVKKTDAARPTVSQLALLKGNISEATQKVVTLK